MYVIEPRAAAFRHGAIFASVLCKLKLFARLARPSSQGNRPPPAGIYSHRFMHMAGRSQSSGPRRDSHRQICIQV